MEVIANALFRDQKAQLFATAKPSRHDRKRELHAQYKRSQVSSMNKRSIG